MSPATASCLIMAGAALAIYARARAARCPARLGRLRCAADRHPISAPHRYGDLNWWDWESTSPRSAP